DHAAQAGRVDRGAASAHQRDCARKAGDHRGYGDPSGALLRHIRGVLDEPAVALRASVGASRAEGYGRCYCAAGGRVTGHLIVVSGLPGVGKTSVAAVVAARTRSVHLSIDAVEETILAARAVAGGWHGRGGAGGVGGTRRVRGGWVRGGGGGP